MSFDISTALFVTGIALAVLGAVSAVFLTTSDYRGDDPHLIKALGICAAAILVGAFIAGGFTTVTT